MCFSATASLSSAAVLATVGSVTIKRCPTPTMRPFAAIPFLFALQQLSEGLLWLALEHHIPQLATAMSQIFNMLAQVFWPAFVPLAVLLLETQIWRKMLLACLAFAGAALAAYHLLNMLLAPIVAVPSAGHIEYRMVDYFTGTGMALYVGATVGALIASSWPWLRLFGLLVLCAFVVTWWAYESWLVSIWCFFAALLSVVVMAHVLSASRSLEARQVCQPS